MYKRADKITEMIRLAV